MRLANVDGRAVLVTAAGDGQQGAGVDVATASNGLYGPDPQQVYDDWSGFAEWAAATTATADVTFTTEQLGPPVPRPPQVFAIGINYAAHAAEAGYPPGSLPVTFTKFPTCLTGADVTVDLPEGNVDWEVELVAVIGTRAHRVSAVDAWDHIAGVTVGQDLSERIAQSEGARPQYSLAKSHPGFGPTGPWLVTPDELPDRDDLEIGCAISGESVQHSRTSNLVYRIPVLIERLSSVVPLLPGDIIFTGTPEGVGNARTPKRFLGPDDELVSEIEGIGSIRTRFRTA